MGLDKDLNYKEDWEKVRILQTRVSLVAGSKHSTYKRSLLEKYRMMVLSMTNILVAIQATLTQTVQLQKERKLRSTEILKGHLIALTSIWLYNLNQDT